MRWRVRAPAALVRGRQSQPQPPQPGASPSAPRVPPVAPASVASLCRFTRPIAVPADRITLLESPADFFRTLLESVDATRRRMVLASLYIGTGDEEKQLLAAIERRLTSSPECRASMLFDFTRSARGGLSGSLGPLRQLCAAAPRQTSIKLYHTPDLRGILKRVTPPRFNETIGVSHLKAFVFDDDVLLTGANLSGIYFTNRQDRYILLRDVPELAAHFAELVYRVGCFSFQLRDDGDMDSPQCNPMLSTPATFKQEFAEFVAPLLAPATAEQTREAERLARDDSVALVFPTLQMGPFQITQDSQLTTHVLRDAAPGMRTYVASAYFNVTDEYADAILASRSLYDIVSAAPEANGFYGASGLARHVPAAYTWFEREFFERVSRAGCDASVRMHEWKRDGWTFHAKGLWQAASGDALVRPHLTMIGSPNFGRRSVERDLEAQVLLWTRNARVQDLLQREVDALLARSRLVDASVFATPDRRVAPLVRLSSKIVKNML